MIINMSSFVYSDGVYFPKKINITCTDSQSHVIYNREIKPNNISTDYMYVQYTAAKAYINKSALLKITILDYMYLFLNGGIFRQRKPILEKGKKT